MINKSEGVNETERILLEYCRRTFFKIWSFPNPIKDDGKELCDLLVVFENYVIIFFIRERILSELIIENAQTNWDRWKRKVIDDQIKTAIGAERYIKSKRNVFLDNKLTQKLPIDIVEDNLVIHKIIVAHGAKEACEKNSKDNIYGSLAIDYTDEEEELGNFVFQIKLKRDQPVHVFDSHNLSLVLNELDTITDFTNYLDEKVRAIIYYKFLSYCGEEDLLAYYFKNYDEKSNKYSLLQNKIDYLTIGEGFWQECIESDVYKKTKEENKKSYFWDYIINEVHENYLKGAYGEMNYYSYNHPIYFMAKEPRFYRRFLSEKFKSATNKFLNNNNSNIKQLNYIPSLFPNISYVLLQIVIPTKINSQQDFQNICSSLLDIACGVTKNKYINLTKIVGFCFGFSGQRESIITEVIKVKDFKNWTEKDQQYCKEQNKEINFFETPNLLEEHFNVTQFVK